MPMTGSETTAETPSMTADNSGSPERRAQPIARRAMVVMPTDAYYEEVAKEWGAKLERAREDEHKLGWWPRVFLVPAYAEKEDAELFFRERLATVIEEVFDATSIRRELTTREKVRYFDSWFAVTYGK